MYDWFNRIGGAYSTNPNDSLTRFGNTDGGLVSTYPMRDRKHSDIYLTKPGGTDTFGGVYPSQVFTAAEDTSTGVIISYSPDTVRVGNAIQVIGPADLTDASWTQPDRITNIGAIHEMQHSLPGANDATLGGGLFDNEFLSAAAEIITGMQDTTSRFECPYTVSLLSRVNAGAESTGCTTTRWASQNYQARTLLAAYLLSQFRGQDTTMTGFGIRDDLMRKIVLGEGFTNPNGHSNPQTMFNHIDTLLTDDSCYTCSHAPAGQVPYLQELPKRERTELVLHNWRVANFVNNSFVAQGQYGYPPHLGFAPSRQVRAWQDFDGSPGHPDCYKDDLLSIPPIVTLGPIQARTEAVFSRERSWTRPGVGPRRPPKILHLWPPQTPPPELI